MMKGGGGCRGSHLQLMTTSIAKTRRLEKEEWTQCPDLGQEAQRQRCPSPRSFLPLSLTPPFPEKKNRKEILALSPPQSVPPLFLSFPRHLILSHFPFLITPHYYFLHLFLVASPLLMPDTTKSAACGLNGNQTLTHSSLACRLLPCTLNQLQLYLALALKKKRRQRKTNTAVMVLLFTGRVEMDRICKIPQHFSVLLVKCE